MAKPKKRRAKKRQNVNRAERVEATPETQAKLAERAKANGGHACILEAMRQRGITDPGHPASMTQEQYDATLRIWDAYQALGKDRGFSASGFAERVDKTNDANRETPRDRMIAMYLKWANELPARLYLTSATVIGWIINDPERPKECMTNDLQRRALTLACDHWNKIQQDQQRANRVERATIVPDREMVPA